MGESPSLPPALPPMPASLAFADDAEGIRYHSWYPQIHAAPLNANEQPLELQRNLRGRFLAALLWRRGKNDFLRGERMRAVEKAPPALYYPLFDGAQRSLEASLALHEADADAHKYAAILAKKTARDTPSLIKSVHTLRAGIQRAIDLRPQEPLLHHMMGVWCYRVATVSWIERMGASALVSGGLPTSTPEEALRYLLRAEALYAQASLPPLMSTPLTAALAYQALGKRAEAREAVERALRIPPAVGEEEEDIKMRDKLAADMGIKKARQ
jgi:tetratricopeptide (TPR) repeat protein